MSQQQKKNEMIDIEERGGVVASRYGIDRDENEGFAAATCIGNTHKATKTVNGVITNVCLYFVLYQPDLLAGFAFKGRTRVADSLDSLVNIWWSPDKTNTT